jgi:hypothetical protein
MHNISGKKYAFKINYVAWKKQEKRVALTHNKYKGA